MPQRVEVIREQHDCPEHITRALILAGGLNRFGQPNYRLVWGWSRLDWIGGEWTDRDHSGNVIRKSIELRRVPKYSMFSRWHLEKWVPPEKYGSPRMWALETLENYGGILIPALGPYPQFGEYEHSITIDEPCALCIRRKREGECEHRGFVQLTTTIAERLTRAIEYSASRSAQERKAAIDQREQWEALQDDKAIDEILGSDPAEIPRERARYLERVVAPQLDQAIANACKKKEQIGNRFTGLGYKASVSPFIIKAHK